ncbi:SRPBCC domain-containing protein [Spongiactinospora sp. TRM90649]|uniref:SRPBCC family protein n=1 Tax=Spongiactinospora sp. TRM90649 TaxID=3031114 RepID=UPI0023F874FA|nr:SRPBCC domain-containing protein [Spongiactinospora sp. TRM90649]MDF5757574.1 SRPBCC domain-containing protein [Spongiactinospora sp. TRM90649]
MGREFQQHDEVETDATPEQVWQAIATGPGYDSWYMGRTEVEPGEGGAVRTDLGGFVMESTITAWEPLRRFAHRSEEAPDGRFIAFEFLIEGRERSGTVLRLVTDGFLPGDDWEAEYDAMRKGGAMYFGTLGAYLGHFAGRTATPIMAVAPSAPDADTVFDRVPGALGLTGRPALGDRARLAPEGLPPIDGVVDFTNADTLGVRTDDALYRFVRGFRRPMVVTHHVFAKGVDRRETEQAWQAWLARLSA